MTHALNKSSIIERLHLQHFFLSILREASKERSSRSKLINTASGTMETEWIVFERKIMFDNVNHERSLRGLQPITLQDFIKKENLAVGHSDYCNKLALYCVNFVLSEW